MIINSSHANLISTVPATTMEDVVESCCVPPGFRFHPTEEELVGYYLARKVSSQKTDLDVIREVDLYRIEPWDLQERCKHGSEEQSEWYFFSYKDRKYPSGTRTNRATAAGFWKATGRDKPVLSSSRVIGMRKTLVFYKGRAPNGHKSDWIMHEYRLQSTETGPPQEEGWVVCRAFQKPIPSQRPYYPPNYCYNSSSSTAAAPNHGNSCYDYGLLLESPLLLMNPNSSSACMKSSPSSFSGDELRQRQQYSINNGGGFVNINAPHALDVIPQMESPSLSAREGSNGQGIDKRINMSSSSNAGHHHQLIDWKVLDKLLLSSSTTADHDHDHNSSNYPYADYAGDDPTQAEHFLSLFDRE